MSGSYGLKVTGASSEGVMLKVEYSRGKKRYILRLIVGLRPAASARGGNEHSRARTGLQGDILRVSIGEIVGSHYAPLRTGRIA